MLIYKSFSVKRKAFTEAVSRLIVRSTFKLHQITLLMRIKEISAAGHQAAQLLVQKPACQRTLLECRLTANSKQDDRVDV